MRFAHRHLTLTSSHATHIPSKHVIVERTLPRLVLTHIPRDIIKLIPLLQPLQRLFLLTMFLAQDVAHVDRGGGLEFRLGARVVF
jgi:hypothetical protein